MQAQKQIFNNKLESRQNLNQIITLGQNRFFDFLRPCLMGWDGWDGMDGMGWDGTEYQKCPLIFFILCGYIHKVYTYLYM